QKERKVLGDKAPPKPIPKTLENQREPDETIVQPQDEEVLLEENSDELSAYFSGQEVPKILVTTSDRPRSQTTRLCAELASVIPSCEIYYRRGLALKCISKQGAARNFTHLIVVNQNRQKPSIFVFILADLGLGRRGMRRPRRPTPHTPEVIMTGFGTRLGRSVGRLLASLFPSRPNFTGRQVATFHNQRDFIFLRFHRYMFKDGTKVGLQELGPRLTLKLRSLQRGTFDSCFGLYDWVHKRHEMDTSRRRFHL
uniref:Ribosome production factor 1 n=1 Tax=Eptatretus burgeri TaxID=7764 RepID=A0A8C4QM40_EPTBU